MAKYLDPTTNKITEIFNPELNPELIKGKTLMPETTKYDPYTGTITAESLAPGTNLPYVNPNQPTPSFPTVPTPTVYEPTPKETDISKLIGELTATTGLAGEKLTYQQQQEQAAGLEAMKKSEADYTYQYKQLEAEFKNLQIKSQKATERLQLEATGRGITVGGLAPITAAEQRKIALQSLDVSSKANTVAALLLGQQGLISAANDRIKKAVDDKFAVREADRKAKLENLELLSKDPTLTAEQKARADAQTAAIKKQTEADEKKKTDSTKIMEWAVELAKNPVIAQQLMKMAQEEDPNLETAFALYSANAPKAEVWSEPYLLGGDYVQKNTKTGEIRTAVNVPIGAGIPEVSPEIIADYARRLDAKEIQLSNVPEKIRNQVLEQSIKAKQPRDFTDEEIRTLINEDKTAGSSYEETVSAMNAVPTLKNKDKAKQIADEIFGKKVAGVGLFGAVSSFFSRLFGK